MDSEILAQQMSSNGPSDELIDRIERLPQAGPLVKAMCERLREGLREGAVIEELTKKSVKDHKRIVELVKEADEQKDALCEMQGRLRVALAAKATPL